MKDKQNAFSLLELSIVILIIALIVGGTILGQYIIKKSRITTARTLTQSSPVTTIDNGPVIWFESSLESSFTSDQQVDNAPLSKWYNITNNGTIANKSDASQSTSNDQPTYANTINYIPAVRFDGTNSYFNFDGSFLNNSDYTIFVVEERESNKADNYFFGDNSVTTTNQNLVLGYSANNQIIHKQGSGNTYTSNIATYDTNHSAKIFTFVQDSNNGKNTYINSYHTGSSNDATQLQNIGTVTLAKSYQGQVGELIIFTRALTTGERQDVETYLSKKWHIDTPLTTGGNVGGSDTECSTGTIIGGRCDISTCNVSLTGISTTSVNGGSGSFSCDAGYSGGPVTYTCSSSVLNTSGSCSAITCSITSQTGLTNQTGLAYTTSPTALTCNAGYSGSPTYTCTASGAATISGSCTAITCSITGQTGLADQSGLAYTASPTSLTCQSGYSGSPTYTCTATGAASISGSCTPITCTITSVSGLNNKTGLAYAASATAVPSTPTAACATGYSGSPTYTCTATGAATIVAGCNAITCSISGRSDISDQSGLSYAASATAVPTGCQSGYSGSPTYTCTSSGAATIVAGCTTSTCNVSANGVSSPTTVNAGSGTLNCNATGYDSTDTIGYTCSSGNFTVSTGLCDTCTSGYSWTGSACSALSATNSVGVYVRTSGSTPATSDNTTWYNGNGNSWTLGQRTTLANSGATAAGLTSTDALGAGNPHDTIVLDLGTSKTCSKLTYKATGSTTSGGWGYTYSNGLALSYWNGSSWVVATTLSGFTTDFQTINFTFSAATAQYWNINWATAGWTCAAQAQLSCF